MKGQCDGFLESISLHKTFDFLEVGHDCDETISLPSSVLICLGVLYRRHAV